MKRLWVLALLLLASPGVAPAQTQQEAAAVCNITVDVTDTDPKGLNVRDTPGGKVITALVDKADWVEVHIVGQQGDWFQIDRANQIDNNRMGEDIVMWKGKGFVHKSTVGYSGMQALGIVRADHDDKSKLITKVSDGDQATKLLGCWHDYSKVQFGKITGWTKDTCTNENTTCS